MNKSPGIGTWEINHDVEKYYLDKVAAFLSGDAVLQPRMYPKRGLEIHASDLGGCPYQPYHEKMSVKSGEVFPLHRDSVMRFIRGVAVEDIIKGGSGYHEPIIKDGIYCSVDDIINTGSGDTLVEMKSTTYGCEYFDPLVSQPEWKTRMATYCHAYDAKQIHLVVLFISGNMADYMPWSHSSRPFKYIGTDFRAYTITYDGQYLADNWLEMKRRAAMLNKAVECGDPSVLEVDDPRCEAWYCKACRFNTGHCSYAKTKAKE
jgi:hypothetical protein